MDTKKLRIIVDALEAGSMRAAAEELNYSQSNVSYAINTVEETLGVDIVNKTKRGISLTEEGKQLYDLILRIIEAEDELIKSAERISEEKKNVINIGTYPIYSYCWVPAAIKKYYAENAVHDDIRTLQGATDDLVQWLETDQISFVIGEPNLMSDDYASIPLKKLRMCAAIPKSYKHPKWDTVRLNELSSYPILYSSLNDLWDKVLQTMDDEIRNFHKTEVVANDGFALIRMVSMEIGVTFLSELYNEVRPDNVDLIPIDPPLYRELGIIYKKDKKITKEENRFFDYVRSVIDE